MITEACATIRRMIPLRTLFFVWLGCPALALAYPSGSGTCDAVADGTFMTSRTHHPGDNGGYALTFSATAYAPGEPVSVLLSSPAQDRFIGFLLYAETGAAARVGLFSPGIETTFEGTLPPPCRGTGHTITQSQPSERTALQLQWAPPPSEMGALTFRALVLKGTSANHGTDFYEVFATLPSRERIFRAGFEGP